MWQDTVILMCSLVFGFILIPQIRYMHRTQTSLDLTSSTTTLVGLIVLGFVYATLNLPFAVVGSVVTASAWAAITALSIRYNHMHKRGVSQPPAQHRAPTH